MWTVVLLATGITGLWLAARHWYGWAITSLSECLWVAYAAHRHDHALFLMAWIWLAVNLRNCHLAWKDQR